MTPHLPIGVIVVDDSRAVRMAFERLLADEDGIDLIAVAADPYECVDIMREVTPDVIILDIVMPRMDGLTFLRKIMDQHPLPVIVCSAQGGPDSGQAVLALERGAVEVIPKPRVGVAGEFENARAEIVRAIRAAAQAHVERRPASTQTPRRLLRPHSGTTPRAGAATAADRVIVIGASTGGTEALRVVLETLPATVPGIVIAQHMPAGFTNAFARRLNSLCALQVSEAQGNDRIEPGTAYVAPGNRHVQVHSRPRGVVTLSDSPPVNRHRPSVDVLFRSAVTEFGPNALGILLTGMGTDGAGGLADLYHVGAETFAQDEATSVVFGMPAAAIKLGAVTRVLPLQHIAEQIVRWAG
jgi:two-component system, chemotaxis family, protein-glutamate methylesterase/glutaminase